MVEHLLVYRVRKSRFCHLTFKAEVCDGVCRVAVSSGPDDKAICKMCPVYVEAFDKIVDYGRCRRRRSR